MKLFVTANSPYARITRIAALESGLADRVQVIHVTTRDPETAFFDISPLGRVPVLVDAEVLIADTRDICAYFDQITGTQRWCPSETAMARTRRNIATGFLDGVAVWLRENTRPRGEQSRQVMRYEDFRAANALPWLEAHAYHPDRLDLTALCLACAIDIAGLRGMASDWDQLAPMLMGWSREVAQRPSMLATAPLPI